MHMVILITHTVITHPPTNPLTPLPPLLSLPLAGMSPGPLGYRGPIGAGPGASPGTGSGSNNSQRMCQSVHQNRLTIRTD